MNIENNRFANRIKITITKDEDRLDTLGVNECADFRYFFVVINPDIPNDLDTNGKIIINLVPNKSVLVIYEDLILYKLDKKCDYLTEERVLKICCYAFQVVLDINKSNDYRHRDLFHVMSRDYRPNNLFYCWVMHTFLVNLLSESNHACVISSDMSNSKFKFNIRFDKKSIRIRGKSVLTNFYLYDSISGEHTIEFQDQDSYSMLNTIYTSMFCYPAIIEEGMFRCEILYNWFINKNNTIKSAKSHRVAANPY